jgi:sugar lactone lactonase YvrE
MKSRSFSLALALCALAQASLAGCTSKGSGSLTPFSPSQSKLYVFNAQPSGGSIAGFPITAAGNVAPSTSISGSLTGLDAPFYGTVDASGTLYAPNTLANSVTTYVAGSTGDVGAASYLDGPYTGLGYPAGIAVATSGDFFVCNRQAGSPYTSVTEYAAGSTGNAHPVATIRGPSTTLTYPTAVGLDSLGYIYVSNGSSTYSGGSIAVFSPNSNGNIAPAREVKGTGTGLDGPAGIALDAAGNLYVANRLSQSVTVYAAGSNGDVGPTRAIAGTMTGLARPTGIAVDSNGYIYVANQGTPSITVYTAGASGNAVPIRTISGSNTGLDHPFGLALY